MAEQYDVREWALRRLPLPYSLALRLREAGVADQVICGYLRVEEAALPGVYRLAEAKLVAAQRYAMPGGESAVDLAP
jgi:hypothetical protein